MKGAGPGTNKEFPLAFLDRTVDEKHMLYMDMYRRDNSRFQNDTI